MSDFEALNHAWEQAEQRRHAALLQQLKAEVRAFRRQTHAAAMPSLPVSQAPSSQPLQDCFSECTLHHDDWTALDWSELDWSEPLDCDRYSSLKLDQAS